MCNLNNVLEMNVLLKDETLIHKLGLNTTIYKNNEYDIFTALSKDKKDFITLTEDEILNTSKMEILSCYTEDDVEENSLEQFFEDMEVYCIS